MHEAQVKAQTRGEILAGIKSVDEGLCLFGEIFCIPCVQLWKRSEPNTSMHVVESDDQSQESAAPLLLPKGGLSTTGPTLMAADLRLHKSGESSLSSWRFGARFEFSDPRRFCDRFLANWEQENRVMF